MRNSNLERVRQLQDAVAAGQVKAGVTYSAGRVAKLLGWNAKTVKRLRVGGERDRGERTLLFRIKRTE